MVISVAPAARNMTSGKTIRPPYCSAQMPRKMRVSDPVRIGVPIRRPNSVSFRLSSCLIRIPMIEKIVKYFRDKGPNPCPIEEAVTLMKILDTFTI